MDNLVILGISSIVGYKFGEFIGGKTEGERGRLHWEWRLQDTTFHLHHWIVMSLLLIAYMLFVKQNEYDMLITGFLLGGIIHGLTYKDWNKIIVQN